MKLLSIGKNQNYFLTDVLEAILTEGKYIKIILAIQRLLKYNNKINLLKVNTVLGVISDESSIYPYQWRVMITNTGKEKYSNAKWKERSGKLYEKKIDKPYALN